MKDSKQGRLVASLLAVAVAAAATALEAHSSDVPDGAPLAIVDLATEEGTRAVAGEWRYSDTRIVEVDYRAPGADGQPSAVPNRTYDIVPHAGAFDFDDSSWPVIDPSTLSQRRSTGRLCFAWYRLRLTVPEAIGGVPTAGRKLVFTTSIDDYAEVWVDGELPRTLGQSGGGVVRGWNATNRVVVSPHARPGQEIRVAVFGMNGPISNPVTNYIWMRSAKLEVHPGDPEPRAVQTAEVNVEVERLDPAIDAIVPRNVKIMKLAEGFEFVEGPVWVEEGYLLFSDPNANRIYRFREGEGLSVFRERSGYEGVGVERYTQPGSNGLGLDAEGRLTAAEHGNRRITRTERDGTRTVLADRFEGKRLNSPNDLVYRSDGTLYFTDPPFGLPGFFRDPGKELPYSGVFRVKGDSIELASSDLTGPNGIDLSPDERHLYVTNWDPARKVVMRYAVAADGRLSDGQVFFDMTSAPGEEALDGLEVDSNGNLFVSGPGGIWVLAPDGRHLGTIRAPRLPANFAWGDSDRKSLYMTARSSLYRMRLEIPGA